MATVSDTEDTQPSSDPHPAVFVALAIVESALAEYQPNPILYDEDPDLDVTTKALKSARAREDVPPGSSKSNRTIFVGDFEIEDDSDSSGINHEEFIRGFGYLWNGMTSREGLPSSMNLTEWQIELFDYLASLEDIEVDDAMLIFSNLAKKLLASFAETRDPKALDSAVSCGREYLGKARVGGRDADIANAIRTLCTLLGLRRKLFHNLEYIEEEVALERESLNMRPPGHPERPEEIQKLRLALMARYSGDTPWSPDVDELISVLQEEVSMNIGYESSSGPPKSAILCYLAANLGQRYYATRKLEDLEESIRLQREALALPQVNTDLQSSLFLNLAATLKKRYNELDEMQDLEEAVELGRKALSLRPPGHLYRSNPLNNLAISLSSYFRATGDVSYLEEAIKMHRELLETATEMLPNYLDSLGLALQRRYGVLDQIEDLEEAIELHRGAILIESSGDMQKRRSLAGLSDALFKRYFKSESIADVEEAVALCKEEKTILSAYSWADGDNRLAAFIKKAIALGINSSVAELGLDKDEMQRLALKAVQDPLMVLDTRFTWAKDWARCELADTPFRLAMHAESIQLLHRKLVVNPDVTEQQVKLLENRELATDAAEFAIIAGKPELAVELLEMGRSVLLLTLRKYRLPLQLLHEANPEIAKELSSVGVQLENLATRPILEGELPMHMTSLDHILNKQRELFNRWETLIAETKKIPGFEDFLGTPSYCSVQAAAKHGPVIFLNVSSNRCDAIIMPSSGAPSVVPLPDISKEVLAEHCRMLNGSLLPTTKPKDCREMTLRILRFLWSDVVSLVVKGLSSLGYKPGCRIWWCPTGMLAMLPIHAAGLYDGTSDSNLPDLYISSYISTASELIISQSRSDNHGRTATRPPLLFVGHSGNDLSNVEIELSSIKSTESIDIVKIVDEDATPSAVLNGISKFPWVHFACHGCVHQDKPLESHFYLQKAQLTVRDILQARLESAEFAFLSACFSADGGGYIPDETIHLASALKFAGFRSVVGSMWEMFDNEGPELTKDFYAKLMKLGGRYDQAAEALHFALRRCRRRCGMRGQGPERWAMFIHVGA